MTGLAAVLFNIVTHLYSTFSFISKSSSQCDELLSFEIFYYAKEICFRANILAATFEFLLHLDRFCGVCCKNLHLSDLCYITVLNITHVTLLNITHITYT